VKAFWSLAVVILAGCGSIATVQPTATPTGPAALRCSLPVAISSGVASDERPAFIRFPDAKITAVTGPSGAIAYDQALSTWVPVPLANLSPDGARYAYSQAVWSASAPPTTHVHMVDVRTGRDRDILDTGNYEVAAFTSDGIYLVHHVPQTDASNGLWLLNLDTGAIHAITTGGIDWSVGPGAGWSSDLIPGDTAPGKFPADRLLRLDLGTGTVTPWFTRPGFQVQVFGFSAAGQPLVVAGTPAKLELWLVTAPSVGTLIDSEPGWSSGQTIEYPVTSDSHGVWINTPRGLYLYRADTHALELEYRSTPQAGVKIDFVAGACR
jgi:hypothetical protein